MKKFIYLALFLFGTVSYAQDKSNDKVKTPKIVTKLKANESYKTNNIEVKLVEIVEDSRCPEGVSCMWAGEAIVLIDIFKDGEKVERKKVTFNSEDPMIFSSEKLTIKGLNVMPYPKDGEKINPKDYYLQLDVKTL